MEASMEKHAHVENESAERNEAKGSLQASRRPVGTDRQEIEWQYEATDGLEKIEEWLLGARDDDSEGTVGSGLTVAGGTTKELIDTYFDTEDWRLYRAGYGLRVRREASRKGSEATMKSLVSPGGVDGSLWRRREISEPLEGDGAEGLGKTTGPVGQHLKALLGGREVRPIFEVHTRRRTFDLLLGEERTDKSPSGIVQDASGNIRRAGVGGGTRVGEVALDSSEIPLGHGDEVASLTRVEVEVDASAAGTAGLEEFVKAMEGALVLRPTEISKYEAGLFATGQSPQEDSDLGSDFVDGSLSVGEVAFAVLRRQFAVMRAHEPGVRLGEDPEELHDMRVATRRMRAAIRLFQDALPERARWFQDELTFFAGVMDDVRDLDVQIERLKEWATQAEEDESREALSEVVAALEERRSGARERLLEALDSARYERFESSFADMLRRGPVGETVPGREPAAADTPILDIAPGLLSRSYRKWRKAAGGVNDASHPEEYHDLRKKGKRLRYALEFLSDVYGKEDTDEIVKPLKKLQDYLGEHQDLIVASDLLEELVTNGELPPRTAFEMGILAGRHRQEAAELRRSVAASKAYRVLRKGKAWEDFDKAMEKQRPGAKARSKRKK